MRCRCRSLCVLIAALALSALQLGPAAAATPPGHNDAGDVAPLPVKGDGPAAHVGTDSSGISSLQIAERAREADRLYASSLKILASLKSRIDTQERTASTSPYFDEKQTTSKLLVPLSKTPFLDYLDKVAARHSSIALKSLAAYRNLMSRSGALDTRSSDRSDLMTKLLKAKYLRTTAKSPILKDKKKAAVSMAVDRLEKALRLGKIEAASVLGDLFLWGRYDLAQNTSLATQYYTVAAEYAGNADAQYLLGFLHSSNFGFSTAEHLREGDGDQGAALLHYTFSALSGLHEAELALGYRHWVGIGVKQNCQDALPWYKSAADKAMKAFADGPAGGRHLPSPKLRLTDVDGGVYGPGASSTTAHHHGHHSGHTAHPKTERDWEDLLEYYHFHADRGDAAFMFRIGRIYYQGFSPMGTYGGSGAGESGGRDFARALRWFMRIARTVWPRDPVAAFTQVAISPGRNPQSGNSGPNRQVSQPAYYDETKDVRLKVDDSLSMAAGLAAGFLGRMCLRGEGFPEADYQKAFLWFQRGAALGDRESHNGLGIMYRDGLGVPSDAVKSIGHFQTAATAEHADALVNVGKYHFARGEYALAVTSLESAIRHGDAFQAYYYLAEINNLNPLRTELCPVATAFYKIVAERGDWNINQPWTEAERAWSRGDAKRALLGYWIMAERGYEVAQNNVAWILDQDKRRLALPNFDYLLDKSTDRLALLFWTRSAAQDNGDALVKMGDYYLKGTGVSSSIPQPEKAAACYAGAANTHYSSIAMYNLGWMHENGIGVSQDFHLAKRYYDLSLDSNTEAYLPVTLSLVKLHLRSLYKAIRSGDIKSISLFLSNEYEYEEDSATDESGRPANSQRWLWSWRRIRDEFVRRWIGEQMARQQGHHRVAQPNPGRQRPEAAAPAPGQIPQGGHIQGRVDLEADDDPVEWARRRREEVLRQDQAEDYAGEDLDIPDFFGDTIGGRGLRDDDDDLLETLAIVGLCLVLGWLVYLRQARYDGARNRQNVDPMQQAAEQAQPPQPVQELVEQPRAAAEAREQEQPGAGDEGQAISSEDEEEH